MKLQNRFELIKFLLPKGKLSRWAIARDIFNYKEPINHPAEEARVAMLYNGLQTRERWKREFRHQRILKNISQGKFDDIG